MAKRSLFIFLAILFLFLFSLSLTAGLEPDRFEDWTGNLLRNGHKENQADHLHFYFHDTLSGKNPSAVRVAQAAGSDRSPTLFGVVMVADDPLTEGPDPDSRLLGRAQGFYSSVGQQELGLLMAFGFWFTDGKYNGSSLSILGRNPALSPVRELPIIGGTGLFRLARGVAMLKTYSLNTTSGDAIVEYNVTVVY